MKDAYYTYTTVHVDDEMLFFITTSFVCCKNKIQIKQNKKFTINEQFMNRIICIFIFVKIRKYKT